MSKPIHYAAVIRFTPAIGEPFDTYRIACGAAVEHDNAAPGNGRSTAVKDHVTCKRCMRSPHFDAALYRGRY